MSGICGIVTFGGRSADAGQIGRMTDVLARRGPEGTRHWHGAELSLGHTLLATTPEAMVEILPLHHPQSGCVITADVRLDNREELLEALGIAEDPGVVGDGRLILEAYLKWGDACLDHLIGDFAFALWDQRKRRLFCARDHFGIRPFTWLLDEGNCLAFASEPGAILALEGIGFRVNDERIADYLADWEDADLTSTFFERIYRLPPAHKLLFEDGRLVVSRYFTLEPQEQLYLPSDEAYAQAFRDVFTDAVRCRLRSAGPVGAMLSGGLDSSSVVAVAGELLSENGSGPLHTFSAVGPDPGTCIETRSVHAMLERPGLRPQLVDHSKLEALIPEIIDLTKQAQEPFDGHMTLPRAVYLAASKAGIKVVLDGVASDVVLSHGSHIARLLRSGNFLQALRDAKGEARFWGQNYPAWRTIYRSARTAFVPGWLRAARAWITGRSTRAALPEMAIASPGLAPRTRPLQPLRESGNRPARLAPYDQERAHAIAATHLTVGRERYDRVASALAIEPRDPFLDLRLVKFCLSLPGKQLERDGWPKYILRNAMAGRLPGQVCWRLGKDNLGWKFTQTLFSRWHEIARYSKLSDGHVEVGANATAFLVDNSQSDIVDRKKLYFDLWMQHGAPRRWNQSEGSGSAANNEQSGGRA